MIFTYIVFIIFSFCFVILRLVFAAAYKHSDGKKIDGKRVLVDVERARTVKGWLARRLGEINIFFIPTKTAN